MWIGDKVYFTSDRDRVLNIWAYDTKTEKLEQITKHTEKEYDVRRPSMGGERDRLRAWRRPLSARYGLRAERTHPRRGARRHAGAPAVSQERGRIRHRSALLAGRQDRASRRPRRAVHRAAEGRDHAQPDRERRARAKRTRRGLPTARRSPSSPTATASTTSTRSTRPAPRRRRS